jgi:hypothetical protein
VPGAVFSAAVGPASEESRAFFQQRLAVFAKIAFLLSSGFFVFAGAIAALHPRALPWIAVGSAAYHLAANLVLLATWLTCQRGVHPFGRLRALETGSVFLYSLAMAIPVAQAQTPRPDGKYSVLLNTVP